MLPISLPNEHLLPLLAMVLSLFAFSAFLQPEAERALQATDATIATGVITIVKAPVEAGFTAATPDAPKAVPKTAASVSTESSAVRRARYSPNVTAAARTSNVDVALIDAVISAESAYDPAALSSTGAVGLMQLMPDTAQRYGVTDRWDPEQNIHGGTRYLRDLMRKFHNNLKLTIAAYNAGEGAVKKYGNRIPPYAETKKYVPKVMAFYKQYRAAS
jgi:soluble lytic murein transglycosylase-like protein